MKVKEENNEFEARKNSDLSQFVRHVHSYIREYIGLADQKAAFIFTVGTGLLAYLNQAGVTKTWQTVTPIANLVDILVPIALVSLGIGILLSVLVVVPNLKVGKGRKGYVFWRSIMQYKSSDDYLEARAISFS